MADFVFYKRSSPLHHKWDKQALICGAIDVFKYFHGTSQEKKEVEQSNSVVSQGEKGDEMCVYAEEASLNNKALRNITQGHMALKAQTCCSKEDLETALAAECVLEGSKTAVLFKKYCWFAVRNG